jgi:hypothetical protein
MHRLLLSPSKNSVVDHVNGNVLDNRRANLRVCSQQQNTFNRKIGRNNKSGYKGVSWDKTHNRWVGIVSVLIDGKRKRFKKRFSDVLSAASFYDITAKRIYKEYAKTNL